MGKETGFLEYERKDRTYADPKERVRHYKEFVKPHAEPDLRLQAARCMLHAARFASWSSSPVPTDPCRLRLTRYLSQLHSPMI